jgi:hypothetical protein
MAGAITAGNDCILRPQQHLIFLIHQDRPKRMVAMVARCLRNLNGRSEMFKICMVQDGSWMLKMISNVS